MSDTFAHLDVDTDEFENAPRALRDAYKELQKSYKSQAQQITDLRDKTTSVALSGVLTGFKNPERVKSAMLSDSIDPLNTEAVEAWLSANGDDYAKATNSAPQSQADAPNYDALAAPSQLGDPAVQDAQLQAVLNAPKDASPEELLAHFRALGI